MYAFVSCYDVDGLHIGATEFMFVNGSTTELAQDLNSGDQYVYVNDLSGFIETSAYYRRSLRVWAYANSLGYTYPPETYSRLYYRGSGQNGLWEQGAGLDHANNRILLREPWSGPSFAAGTKLSQGSSGGTYPYTKSNFPIGPEWTKRETVLTLDKVRPGTVFLKVG